MAKKRNIRREDVRTEADKIAFSRQQYDLWQAVGDMPDEILDFEKFPPETEPWHSPEYWIMVAKAEREKRRLLYGK